MRLWLMCSMVVISSVAMAQQATVDKDLPNPLFTPGTTSPAVTQATIKKTICVPGYTATIRPPSSYTSALKAKQLASYYKGNCPGACEEDHLISLELGGNPTDEKNLWPEPNYQSKDACENRLNAAVCSGALTLHAAQVGISHNWKTFCALH